MNVLSLFDGISCGQVALQRAEIKVENYYASEIDKHAIKVTQRNYPNTVQLGDVTKLRVKYLPKIDILIGGSPCQGFSFAGKQLNFNDPRSALFFEYIRILKECKPKYFLLENVRMKKEYQEVITNYIGVEPIKINSALVSAQNRMRLYWTNIPNLTQPEDKGILIKDIIDSESDKSKYILSGGWLKWWKENKEHQLKKKYSSLDSDKAICMVARQYSNWNGNFVTIGAIRGRGQEPNIIQTLELRKDEKTNTLTTVAKDNNVLTNKMIRKLTPIECERLQTLPDNYTQGISDTQRYKALGNGWTVDVIAHIFKNIKL